MVRLQRQRARGRDILEYRGCRAIFLKGRTTNNGWTYVCPGYERIEGIGEGLRHL